MILSHEEIIALAPMTKEAAKEQLYRWYSTEFELHQKMGTVRPGLIDYAFGVEPLKPPTIRAKYSDK